MASVVGKPCDRRLPCLPGGGKLLRDEGGRHYNATLRDVERVIEQLLVEVTRDAAFGKDNLEDLRQRASASRAAIREQILPWIRSPLARVSGSDDWLLGGLRWPAPVSSYGWTHLTIQPSDVIQVSACFTEGAGAWSVVTLRTGATEATTMLVAILEDELLSQLDLVQLNSYGEVVHLPRHANQRGCDASRMLEEDYLGQRSFRSRLGVERQRHSLKQAVAIEALVAFIKAQKDYSDCLRNGESLTNDLVRRLADARAAAEPYLEA